MARCSITGRALGAVVVDVMGPQALGHGAVHLQRPALPVPPDGIAQHELELRPVEGALPLVQGELDPGGAGGSHEGSLGPVPDRIRPHPLGRPVGELDPHVLEAEVPVDVQDQAGDGDRTPR